MSVTQDWSDLSLMGLFRLELETQAGVISNHLLTLESQGQLDIKALDALMRAAHSIKGAARIVQVDAVIKIAHVLEDFFTGAKQGTLQVSSVHVDVLLKASDFMLRLSSLEDEVLVEQSSAYEQDANTIVIAVESLVNMTAQCESNDASGMPHSEPEAREPESSKPESSEPESSEPEHGADKGSSGQAAVEPLSADERSRSENQKTDRMVRLNADNLNRLMGLAGESVLDSNWLQPFTASLLQLKQQQQQVMTQLEMLSQEESKQQQLRQQQLRQQRLEPQQLEPQKVNQNQVKRPPSNALLADYKGCSLMAIESTQSLFIAQAVAQMQYCQQLLNERLSELDGFSQRFSQRSDRLYREMIASHMCAFEVGTKGYSRLVRDLAKTLDKQVQLKIEGLSTQVDRTLLEKLDAPIVHLITNAIAHGIEPVQTRRAAGKPEIGTLRVEAIHHGGMLRIIVEDDGGGFDFAALRQKIVVKGMSPADVVARLSEPELIEFLFLPGFSTRDAVDHYSGRGYGLDIARSMVQSVGGSLLASSTPGKGTRFQFQLPLTLSVVRSLIFEVGGEPYALNLAHIGRVLKLSPDQIRYSENRPYFSLTTHQSAHQASEPTTKTSENVSLVSANQLLAVTSAETLMSSEQDLWVIVLGDAGSRYGLCVERLRGEKDLVVRPLDPRLGKVPNISSAALSEKGEPILILDVADVLCSAANLAERAPADMTVTSKSEVKKEALTQTAKISLQQKKVLVVDDSMTVRAMEKKLLQNRGYAVDMAVDGADGWNALRMNTYDLVITDIDMPRLNGIELIEKIRAHAPTKKLPVIVVSYKDHQADQLAGLEAGANYYLTKSSFHNDGLINAVVDLIGVSVSSKRVSSKPAASTGR